MKERLIEMLAQSVIFQGLLMVMVVGAWVYTLVSGLPTPDELSGAALLIIGFFFGGKYMQSLDRASSASRKEN